MKKELLETMKKEVKTRNKAISYAYRINEEVNNHTLNRAMIEYLEKNHISYDYDLDVPSKIVMKVAKEIDWGWAEASELAKSLLMPYGIPYGEDR